MRWSTLSVMAVVSLVGATAQAQEVKGGEDETGPYEVVTGWPRPWSKDGYIWGSQPAVFAESSTRIFIGARGELKAPENPPRSYNGSLARCSSAPPTPGPKSATASSSWTATGG